MNTKQNRCGLPPALARFLKAELGYFRLLGGGLQGESTLWALTSGQGKRLFLKQPSAHAFERELRAYCDWLPRLPPATPTLVGYRRSPWRRIRRWLTQRGLPNAIARRIQPPLNALLLSAVPGQRVDRRRLSTAQQQALHFQAGRFLNTLHTLPRKEPPPTACGQAAARCPRAARWVQRAEGLVSAAAIEWVWDKVRITRFQALDCVSCHWDYQPRNGLVESADEKVTFSVIDFGDARDDIWLADLRKLYGGVWADRPDLEQAFLHGYGRALTHDERAQLRALAALDKLEAIVWSIEHRQARLEADNRQALAWLMREERESALPAAVRLTSRLTRLIPTAAQSP